MGKEENKYDDSPHSHNEGGLRGIESGGPKYSHYLLRVQTDCFVRKNPEFKRGTENPLNMDDVFEYYSTFTTEAIIDTSFLGQIRAIPE